jgi:hypothetical protein
MEAALLAEALKSVPFTEARSSHLTRAFEVRHPTDGCCEAATVAVWSVALCAHVRK